MRVDDLNAMFLKVGVMPMPQQLTCMPNSTPLSFPGHKNNAILQVKTSVNACMAKLVNLGAGMNLPRGERCEGMKKKVASRNKTLVLILCH